MTDVRELVQSRELLTNLVQRDLRSMYKGTLLGWGWSLINPLAQVIIYTFVFGVVFRAAPPPGASGLDVFAIWLLCGLLAWNYFSMVMNSGMTSLVSNTALLQKTYFPRGLLVIAPSISTFVTFSVEMVVLCVVLSLFGVVPVPWLLGVVVLMGLLAVFAVGVGFILSVANVYFRDTPHLMGIFTQVWFYATPIIYPINMLEDAVEGHASGEALLAVYEVNPMVHFVGAFRALLYYQELPGWRSMAYIVAVCCGTIILGWRIFRRFEPRIAEEL